MPALPETRHIKLLLKEGVLYLTLNRPNARNAMNAEMVAELTETFAALARTAKGAEKGSVGTAKREQPVCAGGCDPEVRAVVMRGAGGNFCAGGDIKDMAALLSHARKKDIKRIVSYNAAAGVLFRAVDEAPQAVVAILEGSVMGGGLGLACAADVTLALPGARFGLPETGLGLIPAQVAPLIRGKVGSSYARLLAVCGGSFDARFAYRIGLVHHLVENEAELEEMLSTVLASIGACAPQALAKAKRLMSGSRPDSTCEIEDLGLAFAGAMIGYEAQEGIAAFLERRKPRWTL